MTIGILAAALGVLISAAAIIIPRIVNRGNNPQDHSDSLAYLKQTGRSAQDIARGNARPGIPAQERCRITAGGRRRRSHR